MEIKSIGEVSQVNLSQIRGTHKGPISYVDTSSVVYGKFNSPIIYSSVQDAPSRARRLAKSGDTVISTVRPKMCHYGYISSVNEKDIFSTGFAVVHPQRQVIEPYYLYLVLTSDEVTEKLQQIAETSTTTYPSIKPSDITSIDIIIPSRKYQQDVADIIGAIDEKIVLNQQINKNLLKLIDNIYIREYFANSQVVLADHVALSDLVQTKTKTFNPKKTSETLVNHFSMPAFDEAHYPIIDKVTSIKSNKNIVEPFSVLVSKMNPQVKRVWLPNISDKILNVASTEFLTFNADSAEMQAFIYAIVNNKSYKQFLMSNTTGSTNSRQRVLPRVAYSFEIAFNRIKAERLGKLLVPFLEKIKLTKSEIQRLKKLRALLLPKLLSGSINLSSMEEAMKNA